MRNVDDEARVAHLQELEAEMTASPDRKLVIEFKLVAKTFKVFVGNDRQLLVQRVVAELLDEATLTGLGEGLADLLVVRGVVR